MSDVSRDNFEIPNRALLKAAEVCDLVKIQPYVLRSWEGEFPTLGVSKVAGGPRVYRRADVEQVARIKHLLLVDGLTLAGARRKIEEESSPAADAPAIDELMGRNVSERLAAVKRGLRSLLDLLGGAAGASVPQVPVFQLAAEVAPSAPPVRRAKPAPRKPSVRPAPSRASTRRKRSA